MSGCMYDVLVTSQLTCALVAKWFPAYRQAGERRRPWRAMPFVRQMAAVERDRDPVPAQVAFAARQATSCSYRAPARAQASRQEASNDRGRARGNLLSDPGSMDLSVPAIFVPPRVINDNHWGYNTIRFTTFPRAV